MYENDNLDHIPQFAEVDPDDVEQEYQLLLLEYRNNPLRGAKNPSRAIIRRRLESKVREALVGEIPFGATPVVDDNKCEDRVAIAMNLLDWSLEQSEEVQNVIIAFLEDPTDFNCTITINRLVKLGAIKMDQNEIVPKQEKGHLSSLLRRQIQQRGRIELQELYDIAIAQHVARRPHAAVRQTIRRFTENGEVAREGDTIIWLGGK